MHRYEHWFNALLLLFVAILSYSLLVNRLGFFADDWYIIWHLRVLGAQSFYKFFATERPWLAYLYAFLTPLIGTSAISWHIFGIFMRWLTALCLYWLLCLTWRNQKNLALMVALLFLVYPGFRQQYASVMYSFGFGALLFELISFSLMILYLRTEKPQQMWFILLLSLLCQLMSIFPDEYFFGFEMLRPIFIWTILREKTESLKQQVLALIRTWLPYALITGLFLYWRIIIFKFPTKYQPIFSNADSSQFVVNLVNIGKAILDDFFEVLFFSWIQIFEPLRGVYSVSLSTIASLAVSGVVFILILMYFKKYYYLIGVQNDLTDIKTEDLQWAKKALTIGLLSILFMGIPFWFVGWQVNLTTGENRFTLPFMVSVCLALVGFLVWLVRKKFQQVLLVGLLVGLSAGQQFRDANSYRLIHEEETTFLQQFLWRAGDLKTGTIILINEFPTNFSSDTVLMSMMNWIYDTNPSQKLKVGLFYLNDKRIGHQITALEKGLEVGYSIRVMRFQGSTSHSLVAYYQKPGCLKVIDPENNYYSGILPDIVQQASFLSNLSQINVQSGSNALPYEQFKFSPEKDWCYYYEKAELMNQMRQWQEVVKLGKEAERKGYKPAFVYEYFPFVKGYIMNDNLAEALSLSKKIQRSYPILNTNLCELWKKTTQAKSSLEEQSAYLTAMDVLDCE